MTNANEAKHSFQVCFVNSQLKIHNCTTIIMFSNIKILYVLFIVLLRNV